MTLPSDCSPQKKGVDIVERGEKYSDDELVMISALQHYLFCKRQCALIHLEGVWSENRLTAEGRILHDKVDRRGAETRRALHQATSLRLYSRQLGVTGVADMVEFYQTEEAVDAEGRVVAAPLKGLRGFWRPFPIEYKHGRPKSHRADEVQLCAQAICLEEMLGVRVSAGALFYGATRRRCEVDFDEELRSLVGEVAEGVHQLIAGGRTPPAVFGKNCSACSLLDFCQPQVSKARKSARGWLVGEMDGVRE